VSFQQEEQEDNNEVSSNMVSIPDTKIVQ